ncbi:TetR/AcrR family transcriptional regulator [Marinilactibacillus kalidii]|uniref:TetR/AcrR family transcriptional regulator n=1 Tax=Marinilactibacillus kalidii TaxID=2820274 RepID=UPI001ABDF5B2|nr:TetR family transcriptional regulator [Marinilactibacillus kalidii]
MQKTIETTDIRKIRTRKFIIDAFFELLKKKSFETIRISDITTMAMINRATFYNHFTDKYELFEVVTKEIIMENVRNQLAETTNFCQNTLTNVFVALTNYHNELHALCSKSYEEMANINEMILRKEVERVLVESLTLKYTDKRPEEIQNVAAVFSWMLYGAAYEWKTNSRLAPEAYFAKTMGSIESILSE